ncbi:MAG: hypothetical protein AB7O66_03870 [Limisphaerales bacterium]
MNVKVVGRRGSQRNAGAPLPPAEALHRAASLQAQADLLNPFSRPRGFVFKAPTWEAYEQWRRSQANPRLW